MFKKLKDNYLSTKLWLFAAMTFASTGATAGIPTVEANSDGINGSGGFWAYITGWFKDIMTWVPLGLMSAATLWVAWSLIQKVLNERNAERPNWGAVFAHAAGCVLLLVITVFLGNQVIGIWA